MSAKIEIEWNLSSDKAHPDKPGKSSYETILCFVLKKGMRFNDLNLKMLQWNCEHLCWDREDGDDHECDVDGVFAWAIVPTQSEIMKALGI